MNAKSVTQPGAEGLQILRHSTAHVLAQAVLSIWPKAKYAGGPAIDDGFYYDFDIGRPFTPADLKQIEARMKKIVEEDQSFERKEVSIAEASEVFKDQPYKLEWLSDIDEESTAQGVEREVVSLYVNGDKFVDLCRGPHIPSTGKIRAFKLMKSSGAYWKGSEHNPMLQRIYGTAWESREALNDYLARLEEAETRDHAKLGVQLGLYMSHDLLPAGFRIWLPNGAIVRKTLEDYILSVERRAGYLHVYTPHLGRREMYEISGHLEHFADSMFPAIEIDKEHLYLKPMNCPHHILVYGNQLRSYRDLPIRIAELGAMYRYEKSGTLRGLSRVRYMTLNDAHIFCRPDQIKEEFASVVQMVESVYQDLGILQYSYRLSLRDPDNKEKYFQNDEMWESAESMLREALDDLGLPYTSATGEAAFYGPKLDIQLADLMGREETYSTVQLDFLLPQSFDLSYKGADGSNERPVMIHRGVISTLERIVAYLTELYGGAFPTWLAPEQVRIIPVAEPHLDYCSSLLKDLLDKDVRAQIDEPSETLGYRVRNAQLMKVPYLVVVGDREVESETVAVRPRGVREQHSVPIAEFTAMISKEIADRRAAGA